MTEVTKTAAELKRGEVIYVNDCLAAVLQLRRNTSDIALLYLFLDGKDRGADDCAIVGYKDEFTVVDRVVAGSPLSEKLVAPAVIEAQASHLTEGDVITWYGERVAVMYVYKPKPGKDREFNVMHLTGDRKGHNGKIAMDEHARVTIPV